MLLLFPINAYAEEIVIECTDNTLENNKETECFIKAKELSFNATNVTGKIEVSDNLKIVSSSYDDTMWKILDKGFTVEDINIISENPNNGTDFTIATFKVQAINKEDSTGEINFVDIEIGDDAYEGHTFENIKHSIELKYDSTNDPIKDNPQTSDIKIIIPIILMISFITYLGFTYKKSKVNE